MLLLLLLAALLLFRSGIELDLERFRPRIETAIATSIGAPVHLGALRVRIAPWTELWIEDGRIGSEGAEWLRVGTAHARLSLLALLARRELRSSGIEATAVTLDFTREPPRPPPREMEKAAVRLVELDQLSAEDVDLSLPSGGAEGSRVRLARFELAGREDEPVEISMQGSFTALALESIDVEVHAGSLLEAQGSGLWPYRLRAHSSGLDLTLEGELPGLDRESAFDAPLEARATLTAQSLEELLKAFAAPLPDSELVALTRPVALSLDGRWNRNQLVTALKTTIAGDTVLGDLQLAGLESNGPEGHLAVSGALRVETLTLEPWLPEPGKKAARRDWREIDLGALGESFRGHDLDLQIGVEVAEVIHPRFDLSQVEAHLAWQGGHLELPCTAMLEGSPIEATVSARSGSVPEVRLVANVQDVGLRRWWSGAAPSDRVSGATLDARATGSTVGEWLETLRFEADLWGVELEDVRRHDLEPVPVAVSELHVTQDEGLVLASELTIFDRELDFSLTTVSVEELCRARPHVPIQVALRGEEGRASIRGQLGLDEWRDTRLALELDARRLGWLSTWIGVPESIETPVEARASLTVDRDRALTVDAPRLRLGNSTGSIRGQWQEKQRRLTLVAESALIDLEELSLGESSSESEGDAGAVLMSWRDLPLIPSRLEDWQVSLDLSVDRLLRRGVDLDRIRLGLELLEDAEVSSSAAFEIAGAAFRGEWSVDRQYDPPLLRLSAETRGLDLGALLENEGILEGLDLELGRALWQIEASGETLGELLDSGRSHLQLEDAVYWLHDETGARGAALRVVQASVEGTSAGGMTASGAASLRETPLTFELETLSFAEATAQERVPFDLRFDAPETEVRVRGDWSRDAERIELGVEAEGRSLAALGPLVAVELPETEPYTLRGSFEQEGEQWSLADLALEWEESSLVGNLTLDLESERPRLTGSIESSRLRVVDVFPEAAAAEPAQEPSETGDAAPRELSGRKRVHVDLPEPFTLKRNPLPALDADLELRLDGLELADGVSASSSARIRLDRTALEIELDGLDARGGSGSGQLRFEPGEDAARLSVEASIDGFDYSSIADRFASYSQEEGTLSFFIDLDTEAPWGTPLLARANGDLAVLVQPELFEALAVDLWAADLATSLLPSLGWASSPSTVNCLAVFGSFEDGVSEKVRAILDTQRVRVNGRGELDLGSRSIDLELKPKPKKIALLSLATPVRIRGSNGDFDVRVTSSGWLWTFVRVQVYVYTLYLQLLKRPLPADGTDACFSLFEGRVEPEKWRPGRYLLEPDALIQEVVEGSSEPP